MKYKAGTGTKIYAPSNLYGCTIGNYCTIAAFVEIGTGVTVGDRCKIGKGAFLPPGITIEDEVFIGPHVTFTNDKNPRAVGDWTILKTVVKKGASIGAGSVILPGITIGEGVMIGAGSIVTKSIYYGTFIGNPAKRLKKI